MSDPAAPTPRPGNAKLSVPGKLNVIIALVSIAVALACLRLASHAPHWTVVAGAAIVFSFANNTIFSLLHECVHGTFHRDSRLNEVAGVLLATFFPTAFGIQRISHFGHHRRNRSDRELYDYYLPHQSRWLKTYWIYCLLTGFYWAIIPTAGLAYLICPFMFRWRGFQHGPARWWGFQEFVQDIAAASVPRLWSEAAITFAMQAALCYFLDLRWIGWIACYWAFGLNWSSLQYTDHAFSPRDVHEGAWNLCFWSITQAIFLNYNLHLVHHRRPDIPWLYLPAFVLPSDPRPSFWSIYWPLWAGARPAPESGLTPLRLSEAAARSAEQPS